MSNFRRVSILYRGSVILKNGGKSRAVLLGLYWFNVKHLSAQTLQKDPELRMTVDEVKILVMATGDMSSINMCPGSYMCVWKAIKAYSLPDKSQNNSISAFLPRTQFLEEMGMCSILYLNEKKRSHFYKTLSIAVREPRLMKEAALYTFLESWGCQADSSE